MRRIKELLRLMFAALVMLTAMWVVISSMASCSSRRSVFDSTDVNISADTTANKTELVAVAADSSARVIEHDVSAATAVTIVDSTYVHEDKSDTLIVKDSTYVCERDGTIVEQHFHNETRIIRDIRWRTDKREVAEMERLYDELSDNYFITYSQLIAYRDSLYDIRSRTSEKVVEKEVVREKPFWKSELMWAILSCIVVVSIFIITDRKENLR